jgi:hypothetical protein
VVDVLVVVVSVVVDVLVLVATAGPVMLDCMAWESKKMKAAGE